MQPSLPSSHPLVVDARVWASPLAVVIRHIFYEFFFSSYVALWDSKTPHRHACERVSYCVGTSPSRLPPQDGSPFLNLLPQFLSFIFCPTSFQRLGCLSGCLVSSSSIQKLFCGSCSGFKWSFGEFVGKKVVSPYYSFAISGLPPNRKFLISVSLK